VSASTLSVSAYYSIRLRMLLYVGLAAWRLPCLWPRGAALYVSAYYSIRFRILLYVGLAAWRMPCLWPRDAIYVSAIYLSAIYVSAYYYFLDLLSGACLVCGQEVLLYYVYICVTHSPSAALH
jgi:hypothetical protein